MEFFQFHLYNTHYDISKKTLSMNKNICNRKKLLNIFILDIVFVNDFGESD